MMKIDVIIQKDKKALHQADLMRAETCYLKAARRDVGCASDQGFCIHGQNPHPVQ
jgi:hypothetical protein